MRKNLILILILFGLVFPIYALTAKDKETICNAVYFSYVTGCTDVYKGKSLTDDEIKIIVDGCGKKAQKFLKQLDMCKGAEFY